VSCAIVLGPVLELQTGLVFVLVLERLVLVLVLGLECMVLGLDLGLEGKVLLNITVACLPLEKKDADQYCEYIGLAIKSARVEFLCCGKLDCAVVAGIGGGGRSPLAPLADILCSGRHFRGKLTKGV